MKSEKTEKIKSILCILLSLALLIPQSATAATTDNPPKKTAFRPLESNALFSIKNSEFSCSNNYSFERKPLAKITIVFLSGFSTILVEKTRSIPGIKGFIIIFAIAAAIMVTVDCLLTYKEYQSLRRSVGRINLEEMSHDDLGDLTDVIGERRTKEDAKIKAHSNQMRSWRFGRDSAPQAIEVLGDRRVQSKALARDGS